MISIDRINDNILIHNDETKEYFSYPQNTLSLSVNNGGYVMLSNSITGENIYGGKINQFLIGGSEVTKDNIFDLFNAVVYSPLTNESFKVEGDIVLKGGKGIKVVNGIVSITGDYVTKKEIEEKEYLNEIPSNYITEDKLNDELKKYQKKGDYVSKGELEDKKYLTEIPKNYITEGRIIDILSVFQPKGEYVTKKELEAKEYISKIPSNIVSDERLSDRLATYQPKGDYAFRDDLKAYQKKGDYVTEKSLKEKGYLTQHQSLDKYVTKDELNKIIGDITSVIKLLKRKG